MSRNARVEGRSPRRLKRRTLRYMSLTILLAFVTTAILTRHKSDAEQAPKPSVPGAVNKRPANKTATAVSGLSELTQTRRNVGKAYYEQGKYPEAIGEFQKVIASGGALATDHLDYGLALMQANRLDAALGELMTAKQMDPKLVAADYSLGILYKRQLRYPDAEVALKRVIESDPDDPATWFNVGTVYFAQKKLPEALEAHQHVVQMGYGRGQNFYVASLFHTFTILVRLKRQAEAQKFLKIHEKMRDKVPNISLQNPALEGGKYGAIRVPPAPATEVAGKGAREMVTFADISSKLGLALAPTNSPPESDVRKLIKSSEYSLEFARQNLVPLFGGSVAVGDYDSDGLPDIYVVVPAGRNHLLHNNDKGTFADVTEKAGVAGHGASLAAAFADYNNSGHPSLFVAGLGGVTLYRNNGNGTFTDETEKAGLKGKPGELDTRALLLDADNDGFLDLVVTAYTDLSAPPQKGSFTFPDNFAGVTSHFYRNNGDGTFAEITSPSGLASAQGRMRGVVFADFNNDGYVDLLFVRDDGPPLLYINQGEGKFVDQTAEAGAALTRSWAIDAQVADFNHDGSFDLALWSPSGYHVLLNQGNGKFVAAPGLPAIASPPGSFTFRGTVADLNGDGFEDLVAVDENGQWHFIANRAGRFREAALGLPSRKGEPFASVTPAWLSSPEKLDLVAIRRNGQLAAFEKQGPPPRWLEVKLNGFKSNTQGIGTIVELKAGNFYSKVQATGGPVRVFAGDLARLDVVRVTWPNQIVQNTLDVATSKPIEVRESERLASSCPFLYVWNGERYVLLTDILGIAPLGELLPDGTRMKPNPEELVRLQGDLRDRNGMYLFQITDEMREVEYFDQLRLFAVDHPQAEEIYSNEIYSSLPTRPALYAVRQKRFPVSAIDDTGRDILPLIREVDGRYPTHFRRDRILGLADLHTLTLDLGRLPSSDPVALYLTGWVFWTDSNASRALMSNAQLQMIPPYLQVRNNQGEWVTAMPDMGLPSGTNRTMRLDLTGKFLSLDHHLRIVTNLCVYWDQIFFTTDEAPAPTPVELPLVSADLHYRGFSTPSSDPAHLKPDSFDYLNLLAEAPWNPMLGNCTRYGAVEKLLTQADDHLVVMATGDELSVKFSGRRLPPLRPGWKRDFFLSVHGWAKDGEPNTAFSRTVEPLPFRQMSNYPYGPGEHLPDSPEQRRYWREYQTRASYLLIPPLAPPAP